ncbi:HAD-IIA family hydrolase [Arcanobacterium phocisimile]|uniref:HAD-IIA family hydrolase n=1 Tax=Arcanobacterium phocisimile TaxID=1302235 RepID=A0ABX7IHW7_9ACTO|nr:HAD-IIA family hydrolase [Arcanobacterium phocisimile]QRV01448.1 HAD-IIA family hydrolase [Arcanobacterium phocisimile]
MTESTILSPYDVILSDLDGVAYRGDSAAVGAVEGYQYAKDCGVRVVYMTNNSARMPQDTAQHLTELGIPTDGDDVVTSAITGVMLLSTLIPAGSKVLPLGAKGVVEALREGGFTLVESADDEPAAVLHGLNPEATWLQLSEAALAIQRGAQYVATNIDATLPKERGEYLGNGSLVAAISHATGVVPPSSGKPEPEMYQLALEKSGGTRPLAIGDRLDTDILGANRAGYDSAHVLTGVTSMRQVMLTDVSQRPTHPIFDLRDLSSSAYQPEFSGDTVTVGDARVAVTEKSIQIEGEAVTSEGKALTLYQYQALVAAVWDRVDRGHEMSWIPEFTPSL